MAHRSLTLTFLEKKYITKIPIIAGLYTNRITEDIKNAHSQKVK
jgi:hypothetical protein